MVKMVYSMVDQAELSPPPLVAENVVGVNKELKKIENHISEKITGELACCNCTPGYGRLFHIVKTKAELVQF